MGNFPLSLVKLPFSCKITEITLSSRRDFLAIFEVTIKTTSEGISLTADALTAMGYDSLVIEDQREYLQFLDANRACWDYIDDALARRLEGLSQIKLYLEEDETAPSRLDALSAALRALRARHQTGSWAPSPCPPPLTRKIGPTAGGSTIPPIRRGEALRPALLAAGGGGPGRLPANPGPRPDLRYRLPPLHPNVSGRLEARLIPGSQVVDLGSGQRCSCLSPLCAWAPPSCRWRGHRSPKPRTWPGRMGLTMACPPPRFQALPEMLPETPGL